MTRVLVVEHDSSTRKFIADLLEERGHEVTRAETLAEAASIFETRQPAILVIDPVLGDGDGLGLIRRAQDRSVRVVMTSAYPPRVQEAIALGIPLVTKPFTGEELLERVG